MSIQNAKVVAVGYNAADYHKQSAMRGTPEFAMSRGQLVTFFECPARWLNGFEDRESKATKWGSVIDCLAIEPEKFNERYAVAPATYPDSKTGEAKEWNWNSTFCRQWRDARPGVEILKNDEAEEAHTAVEALRADAKIDELIRCSQKQVYITAEYHHGPTGITVPLKALIDLIPDKGHPTFGRTIADFKTARSANPRAWTRVVAEHGYDVQAAFYLDLYVAATGEDRTDWLHAIQENEPPYQTGRRLISSAFVQLGRDKYITMLSAYAQCLKAGVWPGYDDGGRQVLDGWGLTDPEPWMISSSIESWGMPEIQAGVPAQIEPVGITP